MVCKVIQRNIRISHRKAQLVCDLIRNKSIKDALIILNNTQKKIAPIIKKLLSSAIANATHNHSMNGDKLYVYNIFANQGPTWKRTMPRARGSADVILKRTTHIEIHLSDNPNERKEQLLALKNKRKITKSPKTKKLEKPIKPAETKPKKEQKSSKPKMVNGISVDQKHTVIKSHEADEYDYEKRLKDWRKKAGYNEKPHKCSKCSEECFTSILLDNGKHICYHCWIKKPETEKKEGK